MPLMLFYAILIASAANVADANALTADVADDILIASVDDIYFNSINDIDCIIIHILIA